VLCCVVLSESFSITMIFPFLANMVLDFKLTDKESEVGFYAGWIASSFSIAQFTSSFMWGKLSDKIGRRPVILVGLLGNLFMIFLFGWSKELWFAILARSVNGFLNGNIGVVKTYLSEITDKSNVTKGFSIFGLCWGTGLIIGPTIGGFLSQPTVKAPHIFPPGSLLDQFPYLLPCLFSCLITLIGLVVGFFYLKETVKFRKDSPAEEDPLMGSSKDKTKFGIADDSKDSETCLSFFTDREIMVTSALYALVSFFRLMLDEVFALWSPQSQSVGGLEFESNQIGIIYAVAGVTGLIAQFFFFPFAIKKLGPLYLYRSAVFVLAIVMALLPLSNLLVHLNSWSLWFFLCVNVTFQAFCNTCMFVSITLLVNNSSPLSAMGAVNGFAQTWGSLLRAIAPTVGSYVLAWSLTNGQGFPLNHYFTFFFIAFFGLICVALAFLLEKKSIEKKKPPEYKLPK